MDMRVFVLVLLSVTPVVFQATSAFKVKVSKLPRTLRQAPDTEETVVIHDTHTYYNSSFYPPGLVPDGLWLDLASLQEFGSGIVTTLNIEDYYEVVPLAFDFPIYGHTINAVGVATSGFLYTGSIYHDFIHLTQYIAALQANFDLSISNDSKILLLNSDQRFTVQWDNLYNVDHVEAGPFTFQMSLFPSGEMHFVYQQIPLPVSELNTTFFPVEVGIADSFYESQYEYDTDGTLYLYIYIYEYDAVTLNSTDNLTNGAYILRPLPNCVIAQSCEECVYLSTISDFDCLWCEALRQCSDGIDRNRRKWTAAGCSSTATDDCSATLPPPVLPTEADTGLSQGAVVGISVGAILLVSLLVIIVILFAVFVYGYCSPTSKLGLFMIEHRPKARYLNKEPTVSSDGEKVNF